ncbi:MAG: hypothetical protein AB7V26_13825 [Lysobacterales bacterium]
MSLRALAFTALSLLAVTATAQVPIEQAMSAAERAATGIDKLSSEQLAALNAWLAVQRGATAAGSAVAEIAPAPAPVDRGPPIRHSRNEGAAPAQAAVADDGPPVVARLRDQASGVDKIKRVDSRLVGDFTGWREGQVFILENGQHWQVLDREAYRTRSQTNPSVNLRRSMLGTWMFRIDGQNRSVRVERIK